MEQFDGITEMMRRFPSPPPPPPDDGWKQEWLDKEPDPKWKKSMQDAWDQYDRDEEEDNPDAWDLNADEADDATSTDGA